MPNFAEVLEEFRKEKQISKKDLARRADLSAGYITLLINGSRTAPREETVKALANALDLDEEGRKRLFEAADLTYPLPLPPEEVSSIEAHLTAKEKHKNGRKGIDWGEAPPLRAFYGRSSILDELSTWVVEDRCQLVAILGMGGIGKTLLAAKLASQIKDEFEYIFWRSLRNSPLPGNILGECVQLISHQRPIDLPER
ncbi:MAG TPA: helix-turn-helix domain-containing protein, partial [Ktedonosporobacter sp.]|nr:helix-turn-helix domain-containing protein [Ktedonosporobacter sp.]